MFAAASAALLTVTLCLPAVDESATVLGVVAVAALVGWTLVAVAVPVGWRTVPRVPLLLAAVPVTALTGGLAVQAAANAVGVASPFTQAAGVRLSAVDPVAAPLLLVLGTAGLLGAAVSFAPRPSAARPQVLAGVVLAAAIGALALHPVPAGSSPRPCCCSVPACSPTGGARAARPVGARRSRVWAWRWLRYRWRCPATC